MSSPNDWGVVRARRTGLLPPGRRGCAGWRPPSPAAGGLPIEHRAELLILATLIAVGFAGLSGVLSRHMERLSRLTPATIDVLKMLVAAEGPVWGLQIVKTTGRPSGSVYPILDRLESSGWVSSAWEDDTSRRGPRRRYYQLQQEARELAAAAVTTLENKQKTMRSSRVRPAGLAEA